MARVSVRAGQTIAGEEDYFNAKAPPGREEGRFRSAARPNFGYRTFTLFWYAVGTVP